MAKHTAISCTGSALLVLAICVSTTGCQNRPDITASSREEAMEKCLDDVGRELEKVNEERERAKADPKSASPQTNENFYEDYTYPLLLDDDSETIEITKTYCKPRQNERYKDLWSNLGFIEYLERPTNKAKAVGRKPRAFRTLVSRGYTWKEQP